MQTRKRSINAVEKELANDAELGITHAHHTFLDFDTQKHGKWTVAEEQRANQLVTDFENGSLLDCENGTTLRSYLARKLNCAPMRISKKFAGRCIGKLSFMRREGGGSSYRPPPPRVIKPKGLATTMNAASVARASGSASLVLVKRPKGAGSVTSSSGGSTGSLNGRSSKRARSEEGSTDCPAEDDDDDGDDDDDDDDDVDNDDDDDDVEDNEDRSKEADDNQDDADGMSESEASEASLLRPSRSFVFTIASSSNLNLQAHARGSSMVDFGSTFQDVGLLLGEMGEDGGGLDCDPSLMLGGDKGGRGDHRDDWAKKVLGKDAAERPPRGMSLPSSTITASAALALVPEDDWRDVFTMLCGGGADDDMKGLGKKFPSTASLLHLCD